MTLHTSLLSTLVGGLHMDAWLKNWIDEWDEGYERLEAAKREREERAQLTKESQPNIFRRLFSKRIETEA